MTASAVQVLANFPVAECLGRLPARRLVAVPAAGATSSTQPAANICSTRRSIRAYSSGSRDVDCQTGTRAGIADRLDPTNFVAARALTAARQVPDLQRPDDTPDVVGVQPPGRLGVDPGQPGV